MLVARASGEVALRTVPCRIGVWPPKALDPALNAVATMPTAALTLVGTHVPDQFPLPVWLSERVRLSLLKRTNTPAPVCNVVPQSSTTSTRKLTGEDPVTVKPGSSDRNAGTSALGVQLPAARGKSLPVTVAPVEGSTEVTPIVRTLPSAKPIRTAPRRTTGASP